MRAPPSWHWVRTLEALKPQNVHGMVVVATGVGGERGGGGGERCAPADAGVAATLPSRPAGDAAAGAGGASVAARIVPMPAAASTAARARVSPRRAAGRGRHSRAPPAAAAQGGRL